MKLGAHASYGSTMNLNRNKLNRADIKILSSYHISSVYQCKTQYSAPLHIPSIGTIGGSFIFVLVKPFNR